MVTKYLVEQRGLLVDLWALLLCENLICQVIASLDAIRLNLFFNSSAALQLSTLSGACLFNVGIQKFVELLT